MPLNLPKTHLKLVKGFFPDAYNELKLIPEVTKMLKEASVFTYGSLQRNFCIALVTAKPKQEIESFFPSFMQRAKIIVNQNQPEQESTKQMLEKKKQVDLENLNNLVQKQVKVIYLD